MVGGGIARMSARCLRVAARTSVAPASKLHSARGIRSISTSAARMHGNHDDHGHDHDFVPIGKGGKPVDGAPIVHHHHDHSDDEDDDSDDEDMVDTVAVGPSGVEYGGPQRGGQFKEPTRFGDWERKGRCTDF